LARRLGVSADRAPRRVDRILSETDVTKVLLEIQEAAAEPADAVSAIKSGKGSRALSSMTKTRAT
jgi:hypothetical protein